MFIFAIKCSRNVLDKNVYLYPIDANFKNRNNRNCLGGNFQHFEDTQSLENVIVKFNFRFFFFYAFSNAVNARNSVLLIISK